VACYLFVFIFGCFYLLESMVCRDECDMSRLDQATCRVSLNKRQCCEPPSLGESRNIEEKKKPENTVNLQVHRKLKGNVTQRV